MVLMCVCVSIMPVIVKSTTTDDWIQVLVRNAPVVA
jgi:hypothetical protein